VFVTFDEKKSWVLANRGPIPDQVPDIKRKKAPTTTKRKLTGFRLRLALKHRPDHIRDALTLGYDA
jgi:hypothetical protein